MTTYKIGRDRNGNKVVRVKFTGMRGFSIQTNGNLPRTHRDDIGPWTHCEAANYLLEHGTCRQLQIVGCL